MALKGQLLRPISNANSNTVEKDVMDDAVLRNRDYTFIIAKTAD